MNSPERTQIEETPSSQRSAHPAIDGLWNRSSPITRRAFCNEVLLTSTGIMLMAGTVAGEPAIAQEPLLAYPPMKIEGAEKLIVGSSLYFEYPTRNDPAVLLRSSEGEYIAFSRKCSHAGCSVEFDRARGCLKCPCHRGVFDVRLGYVMYGPPQRPLDQIVLQMRAGGHVWAIGKSIGKNAERITRLLKTRTEENSYGNLKGGK